MARLVQINISPGGVPKRPVEAAEVRAPGLVGDGHSDPRHGGPEAALCLFSAELIRALQAEGHPIFPGSTGENLTIEGLDWNQVRPGTRIRFASGVEIEVTRYTTPCSTIRGSFLDGQMNRVKQALHPGWSRVYAKVLAPGMLRRAEEVELLGGPD